MKAIKYIKLPTNFLSNSGINFLIEKYGHQILGRMISLMELMTNTNNEIDLGNELDYAGAKVKLHFKKDVDFVNFLELICKTEFFFRQENKIFSVFVSQTAKVLGAASEYGKKGAAIKAQKALQSLEENQGTLEAPLREVEGYLEAPLSNPQAYKNKTKEEIKPKEQLKETSPLPQHEDNKTEQEPTIYTDRIIYNEAVAKYTNRRFKDFTSQGQTGAEVSAIIKKEAARLFALEEGR